jgi:hypothetical protein
MFDVKPCDHPTVTRRRIVEGEAFGFPYPSRWPGGSKASHGAGASARRWPVWKVGYFAFIAILVVLVALAFVWVGVFVFWRP